MSRHPFDLSGMTAFVAGAGRGLGRGCALALAEAGAKVICAARTESELVDLAEEIRAAGGQASVSVLDVTDRTATRQAIADLPRLDILVANAGSNRPKPYLEVPDEDLDFLLDLNLASMFVLGQAAAQKMLAQGTGGSIIHMTSQMGRVGGMNRSVYCATKWGLEGLVRASAIELAPHGIRVNAVAPTFVDTPLTKPFFEDPAFRQWVMERLPIQRLATVEEVAAAVVYLASPATASVTGTSLAVDGGWTAQ
ncbi:MAG TPA: SDR family oxidoreductase [Alphaproteobacteria bacterium]|nr:SDR family oxidoreductase [Alphaproteobacteria bacterium]